MKWEYDYDGEVMEFPTTMDAIDWVRDVILDFEDGMGEREAVEMAYGEFAARKPRFKDRQMGGFILSEDEDPSDVPVHRGWWEPYVFERKGGDAE